MSRREAYCTHRMASDATNTLASNMTSAYQQLQSNHQLRRLA